MAIKPIFLFSLPRAGSTLVQRVLSMHPCIKTTAEPWILLPLLGLEKRDVILSQYNQRLYDTAVEAFIEEAGGREEIKSKALRNYGMSYYEAFAGKGVSYFLDKTPRYHFASASIARAFREEGRCILLWRNPLAVLASIVETFGKGRWNLLRWNFDLFAGIEGLWELKCEAPQNLIEVHYEKLAAGDQAEWARIYTSIGLDFSVEYLSQVGSTQISGFGDPTGQTRYDGLSSASLSRWHHTFSTPNRKRFARKWLSWIGEERLSGMGYNMRELLRELDAAPLKLKKSLVDLTYACRDQAAAIFELDAMYRRIAAHRTEHRNYIWS